MAKEMTIAAALHKHVFGPDDPSDMLVDAGRFPMGWVKEYRRLLRLVEVEWLSEPLWPRDLVVALYYVATHLELRYKT